MPPEMRTALMRAWPYSVLVGLSALLTLLPDPTISWRTLVSGSLLPAVTALGYRWLGEGWYDTRLAQAKRDNGG